MKMQYRVKNCLEYWWEITLKGQCDERDEVVRVFSPCRAAKLRLALRGATCRVKGKFVRKKEASSSSSSSRKVRSDVAREKISHFAPTRRTILVMLAEKDAPHPPPSLATTQLRFSCVTPVSRKFASTNSLPLVPAVVSSSSSRVREVARFSRNFGRSFRTSMSSKCRTRCGLTSLRNAF